MHKIERKRERERERERGIRGNYIFGRPHEWVVELSDDTGDFLVYIYKALEFHVEREIYWRFSHDIQCSKTFT